MTTLLSTDPAQHPIGEERVGLVGNRVTLIHAARQGGPVWSNRAGDIVEPRWVRDIASMLTLIELAAHLIDTSNSVHVACAALTNWRLGMDDARMEAFQTTLEREATARAGGLSC